MIIDYLPGEGTRVYFNTHEVISTDDNKLYSYLLNTWLGRFSLNRVFREKIAGASVPEYALLVKGNEALTQARIDEVDAWFISQEEKIRAVQAQELLIANIIEKQGERFAKRILTTEELSVWINRNHSVNYLAKRFAAKEAISKALGTGIAKGVGFQQMAITSDEAGKPIVTLSGQALIRSKELGGDQVMLSLSDEGDMILAFAVLS